jgi:hypothetical protein
MKMKELIMLMVTVKYGNDYNLVNTDFASNLLGK